jgi:hypothetical protein
MEIKPFIARNIVLLGTVLSICFLFVAGFMYPGGSPKNMNSIGYRFTENYISNLLTNNAVNGMENKARPFGVIGVVLLGLSSGLAFVRLSQKVNARTYSVVIKYLGIVLILFSVLITVPALHDIMILFSSIATLLLFFYVSVLLIKSKLLLLKCASVLLLLISYGAASMYFFRAGLDYLPIVQKSIHLLQIIFILGLEYLTTPASLNRTQNE